MARAIGAISDGSIEFIWGGLLYHGRNGSLTTSPNITFLFKKTDSATCELEQPSKIERMFVSQQLRPDVNHTMLTI